MHADEGEERGKEEREVELSDTVLEEEGEEVWEGDDAGRRRVEWGKWNAGWNEGREDTVSVPCSRECAETDGAETERVG